MTTTAPAPVTTNLVPWEDCSEEGVRIIQCFPPIKDIADKIRLNKPVDPQFLGRKLIHDHLNGHLVFRALIFKMVGIKGKKEQQCQAAIFLVEQYLATFE